MSKAQNHKRKKSFPTRTTETSKTLQGYRSKFELSVANNLEQRKVPFQYESEIIRYVLECRYTPDFILPNGIIIETKGRLLQKDARKHRAIKKQHPELDIRFVFTDINKRVENSKFTNYQWCQKYGFEYAERVIPQEWIEHGNDKSNRKSLDKPRQHRTHRGKRK